MPKRIDPKNLPARAGSFYPPPYDEPCRARERRRLGDAAGLTQFGVNLTTIEPGGVSAQRHWHTHEDEFVYVLSGEMVLITDAGEEAMGPGDCAGFRAGDPDGHHLVNRSSQPAVILEIGTRTPDIDTTTYPDIDLMAPAGEDGYFHKDGTPY
jgi:uncharacterized cupin superfamily protein